MGDFLNLSNLVLSFCNSSHLNTSVIVIVDSAEVTGELLVKDVWSQVLLSLNKDEVVSVVFRDSFVHFREESLSSLWTISSACDDSNKDDVEHHVTLNRGTCCHTFHLLLAELFSCVLGNPFYFRHDSDGLVGQLGRIELLVDQFLKDDHVAVSSDEAVVHL